MTTYTLNQPCMETKSVTRRRLEVLPRSRGGEVVAKVILQVKISSTNQKSYPCQIFLHTRTGTNNKFPCTAFITCILYQ